MGRFQPLNNRVSASDLDQTLDMPTQWRQTATSGRSNRLHFSFFSYET